jgi:hypothetical protein
MQQPVYSTTAVPVHSVAQQQPSKRRKQELPPQMRHQMEDRDERARDGYYAGGSSSAAAPYPQYSHPIPNNRTYDGGQSFSHQQPLAYPPSFMPNVPYLPHALQQSHSSGYDQRRDVNVRNEYRVPAPQRFRPPPPPVDGFVPCATRPASVMSRNSSSNASSMLDSSGTSTTGSSSFHTPSTDGPPRHALHKTYTLLERLRTDTNHHWLDAADQRWVADKDKFIQTVEESTRHRTAYGREKTAINLRARRTVTQLV